jgi:hypothetical protein
LLFYRLNNIFLEKIYPWQSQDCFFLNNFKTPTYTPFQKFINDLSLITLEKR